MQWYDTFGILASPQDADFRRLHALYFEFLSSPMERIPQASDALVDAGDHVPAGTIALLHLLPTVCLQ